VRIFNERMEQVQIHARLEAGKFSRILGVAGMSAPVLSSCRWWVERAALLGEACGQWAQAFSIGCMSFLCPETEFTGY
jgi:hypothetical protein